jgi:hypothetical protein
MNRTGKVVMTPGRNRHVITCRFAPDTANAPTMLSGVGVAGVVRTSQGLFTITLDDVWSQLDSWSHSIQLASAAARFTQLGAVVLASKTIQVRVVDAAGAVQDVAADDNNTICVELKLRQGSVD